MRWRATLVAWVGILTLAACGGGAAVAAAPSADELQSKMAIVQQEFQVEQKVLETKIESGFALALPATGEEPVSLFEILRDPTILLRVTGGAAEVTAPDALVEGWTPHARAFCDLGPADWNDDFFLVYGGPHVLPAMVAFLDASCGLPKATAFVAAAKARGLGRGMVASSNPDAGIDLDALLAQLGD